MRGRTPNSNSRANGMVLRYKLANSLTSHDMHRPTAREWDEDNNIHVNRIK